MKMVTRFYAPLRTIAVAMLSLFICENANAQKQELDSLVKRFDNFRTTTASEKLFAHTDHDTYLTGETMWFKLYAVDATSHTPVDISKVAYVEVIDQFNHPVLQSKVNLLNGYGNGFMFLPASIVSGHYTLRAYTNWMKNFSPDFYFHKSITVINTFRKLELDKSKPLAKNEVQFLPEGGNLVTGVKSTVAFAVSSMETLQSLNGKVVNQSNDTIASFSTNAMGMGSFDLTPEAGKEYTAVMMDEKGTKTSVKLPKPIDNGYVMHVIDSTEGQLAVRISTVKGSVASSLPVYLFVHTRNMVSTASYHFLPQGTITIMVPKNKLQEGISHITIFDHQLRPQCERLYFKPISKALSIQTALSQKEFGIRRKVSLDLTTQDADKKAVNSNLSVSIYKIDSIGQNGDGNILNYIWLDSDLKNAPQLPVEFFDNITAEKKAMLDLIMLTNGWRRFKWSDVMSDTKNEIAYIPEFRGHIIRGKVTDPEGKPVRNKTTYLSAPGLNIQVYGSISNNNGDVQFEMKDFSGPRRIVVQTNIARDSTSKIEIFSPFSDKYSTRKPMPFTLAPALGDKLLNRSISLQVQDIFYQDKGAQSRSVAVDTTAFYGKADATYYLDDYTRFPVMEEIMREYVPGVLVRKRRDGFHFINLDVVNKGVFDEDPFIMLDGIPLFDADRIMAFDPLKVKKLEVVTRRYYMGALSLPGIVSYTTYAGDLAGFQLDPKSVVLDYEGLQFQREFYAPLYDNNKLRDSRLPDQRNLLYWSPNVTTGADGKQHVEFFTSDVEGKYKIVVEGNTKGGLAGSTNTSFVVRQFDN